LDHRDEQYVRPGAFLKHSMLLPCTRCARRWFQRGRNFRRSQSSGQPVGPGTEKFKSEKHSM